MSNTFSLRTNKIRLFRVDVHYQDAYLRVAQVATTYYHYSSECEIPVTLDIHQCNKKEVIMLLLILYPVLVNIIICQAR